MDLQYIAMRHTVFVRPLTASPLMDFEYTVLPNQIVLKQYKTLHPMGFEYILGLPNLVLPMRLIVHHLDSPHTE